MLRQQLLNRGSRLKCSNRLRQWIYKTDANSPFLSARPLPYQPAAIITPSTSPHAVDACRYDRAIGLFSDAFHSAPKRQQAAAPSWVPFRKCREQMPLLQQLDDFF